MAEQVRQGLMTLEEVAEYTGYDKGDILEMRSLSLGRIMTMWRCGETGQISDGPHDCSCDSVICDLGEDVTVMPQSVEFEPLQDKGSDEAESPVSSISYEGGAGDP